MPTLGYLLYQSYLAALAKNNVSSDAWEDLPESDRVELEDTAAIFAKELGVE